LRSSIWPRSPDCWTGIQSVPEQHI
jgi:hypothetical protein